MVDFKNEIVRNMKQRVRTPEFLNRVIKVYDFTTLFSRLMMYRRAKSSLVQPKKEGEEEWPTWLTPISFPSRCVTSSI